MKKNEKLIKKILCELNIQKIKKGNENPAALLASFYLSLGYWHSRARCVGIESVEVAMLR